MFGPPSEIEKESVAHKYVLLIVDMAFTKSNVLRAVWNVKRSFSLMGKLSIPFLSNEQYERQFLTIMDEETRRSQFLIISVSLFMDHDPQASWRSVIVALDAMREKELADRIRHLAEPITGDGSMQLFWFH